MMNAAWEQKIVHLSNFFDRARCDHYEQQMQPAKVGGARETLRRCPVVGHFSPGTTSA